MTITTTTVKTTKVKHYVNNEHFLEKMVVFRAAVKEAKETNAETPKEYLSTLANVCLRLQRTWHVSQTLQTTHSKKIWYLMALKTAYCTLITLTLKSLRIHLHTLPKSSTMHSCEESKKKKTFIHKIQEHGQFNHYLSH